MRKGLFNFQIHKTVSHICATGCTIFKGVHPECAFNFSYFAFKL